MSCHLKFLLISVCLATSTVDAYAQSEAEVKQTIQAVWSHREAKLSNVSIDWKTTAREQTPASADPFAVAASSKEPNTITIDFDRKLQMEGMKFRFEDHRQHWRAELGRVVEMPSISVFDGQINRMLMKNDYDGATVRYQGHISDNTSPELSMSAAAVIHHLRPLQQYERFVANGKLQNDRHDLDGTSCFVFQNSKTSCWISPGEGYAIRRITRQNQQGEIYYQDDRKYRETADGWMLSHWQATSTDMATKKVARDYRAEVTDLEIVTQHDPRTWYLAFPRGTVVFDGLGKSQSQIYIAIHPRDLESPDVKTLLNPKTR